MIFSTDNLATLARLGQTVRQARLRRNWSQTELAGRIGASRQSVVSLEKGDTGISLGLLLKALDVFGYGGRLGEILGSDPIGDDLATETGRRRAGRLNGLADF